MKKAFVIFLLSVALYLALTFFQEWQCQKKENAIGACFNCHTWMFRGYK